MSARYIPQHAKVRDRKRRRVAAAVALSAVAAVPSAWVTVHSGDTLSGIAARQCSGHANDWTGIWKQNKNVIGANPNLIFPGQRLSVNCEDPPELLKYGSGGSSSAGRTWGVTYGYPNYCGDGDGDGWDVKCASRPAPQPAHAGLVAAYGAGHLSPAQVGAYWLAAGGPAWAEGSAEAVAMCESGDNTGAYNPSGASGLWQILGAVIPGDLFSPMVNAENAVAKFKASGDTWAQWVCQP